MVLEWISAITSILAIVAGGGWFLSYRAYKRKANGEAVQAEADGWAKQQEVYHKTIEELKTTCEYIANDRNLLRVENTKLREENNELRNKINDMDNTIFELKKGVSRLGRRIEAITNKEKRKAKDENID